MLIQISFKFPGESNLGKNVGDKQGKIDNYKKRFWFNKLIGFESIINFELECSVLYLDTMNTIKYWYMPGWFGIATPTFDKASIRNKYYCQWCIGIYIPNLIILNSVSTYLFIAGFFEHSWHFPIRDTTEQKQFWQDMFYNLFQSVYE